MQIEERILQYKSMERKQLSKRILNSREHRRNSGNSSNRQLKSHARISQMVTEELQSELYQRFQSIMNAKRKEYLKARLNHYYGKNFPINYKDHYDFQQQWENKESVQLNKCAQIRQKSTPEAVSFLFIRLLLYILTIWFSNIEYFIRQASTQVLYQIIFILAVIVESINMILRVKKAIANNSEFSIMALTKDFYLNVVIIAYLSLKLCFDQFRQIGLTTILEILFVYLIYFKAREIYQTIRLMSFAIHYQYHSKLFDLISTLVIIAHFVAILLHLATRIGDYPVTWQSSLPLQDASEFVVYLYAFYFGSTTILTVGYGDISPKNPAEVAVVTLVEIFGIIMFAYIINQIGYNISSSRKERQLVERDLSTMEKIKKHYRMSQNLSERARSFIIHQKPNVDKLVPEEESRFLMKFKEQLRNQIVKNNYAAVIKSSLFFVIRWSKCFQTVLATRLNHILFSPNDLVYQPEGKERIYIVKSGKIDIFAKVQGNRKMKNLMKKLDCSRDKQISDNCYGYTSVISVKTARLYAIAKDFVSSYYVDKEHFMECIQHRLGDLQFYHELKDKINHSPCKQAMEVPFCESSKHHYNPTKAIVIRKLTKSKLKNGRKNYSRSFRQSFRGQKIIIDPLILKYISNRFMSSSDFRTLDVTSRQEMDQILQIQQPTIVKRQRIQTEESEFQYIYLKSSTYSIEDDFESAKEYQNYFPKSNLIQTLKKYENELFASHPNDKTDQIQKNELMKSIYSGKSRINVLTF